MDNEKKKNRAYLRMHQALIAAQELGDEKMNVVQNILDKIEMKTRLLEQDYKNLGINYNTVINSSICSILFMFNGILFMRVEKVYLKKKASMPEVKY